MTTATIAVEANCPRDFVDTSRPGHLHAITPAEQRSVDAAFADAVAVWHGVHLGAAMAAGMAATTTEPVLTHRAAAGSATSGADPGEPRRPVRARLEVVR